MKQFCPEPISLEAAQRILIVRRNLLGDLLCAKPLLTRCRQLAPQAEITLLGDKGQKVLLPYLPEVDRFIDAGMSHSKLAAGYALGRSMRGQFDVALCARGHPNKWCNLFLYGLGSPQRGAHIAVDWQRWWINRPLWGDTSYQSRTHQALKSYHLVEPSAEHVPPELYPKIIISAEVREKHGPWLAQQLDFGPANLPILLLSVSNNRDHCQLQTERTLQAVHRLAERHPLRVVISARPAEAAQAEQLAAQLRVPVRAVPTESFDALLLLVEAVHCLFIGEGGLMHMAAALDKRQLALIGQSSPLEWWPMSDQARWLSHALHVNGIPQQRIEQELVHAWGD